MDRLTKALIGIGLAACLLGAASCSPSDDTMLPEIGVRTSGEAMHDSPDSMAGSQEPQVTLLTWREYVDPDVISDFSAKTGIKVIYEYFADSDETEAMVREEPGAYDLVIFDHENVELFQKLQLLHPLDHSKLPNFSNLAEQHTDQAFDPGNQYSVPYLWGTTLIAYRKDKISNPEESWAVLWDPAHKGHVAMLDERSETIIAALLKNGFSVNDRTSTALSRAEADLLSQVRDLEVRFIEGVPSSLRRAFDSDIWATMAYNGDAIALAEEDPNIGYFVPKEGCALWSDLMVITRDSRHIDEAHAFIDHILTAEAAAKNAEAMAYATPNEAALQLLAPEFLANPGIFPPPDVLSRAEISSSTTLNRERPFNDIWRNVLTLHETKAPSAAKEFEGDQPTTSISATSSE